MEDGDDNEFEGKELPSFAVKVSYDAKLKELLRNITSVEVKLCSDASKEFIKLLRGDTGGDLLREYVPTSSKCTELLQAWKLRQGKPGMSYVLLLISAVLSHPDGKYTPNDQQGIVIARALDKFARLIIAEKLEDFYKELISKEVKRQNAALLLLAAIVRRGSGLASDIAKSFDFKLPMFPKLAEYRQKKVEVKRKHSTRESFIGFAMSFLEVGKPGLLRWVLQQKEMYSGVLRGLGNDDDEAVVYVLSTLRDRVLTPESLVPPGLRSVLFGSVTLDQLISISGRENGGLAAEMAHTVLIMVCTDPSNGLMPDLKRYPNPLRGNTRRLLGLMTKLKAIEVDYHRALLVAIVTGRPSFGSAYLDEFPYNLEDPASPTWFAAVSLAANLVSSVATGLPSAFLDSLPQEPPSFGSPDMQSVIKCIVPRPFTRLVINKGLLHSDSLVKHATLKFLFEAMRLLDLFIDAVNTNSRSGNQMMHGWASLKQNVLNEVRVLLPDPQVLLSLLSSLNSHYGSLGSCLKRAANSETMLEHNINGTKKLKTSTVNDDSDILVSGITSASNGSLLVDSGLVLCTHKGDESDNGDDHIKFIAEIWGLHECFIPNTTPEDGETYFYSKLLDTLKIYNRTMPTVLEGSFDFFKILPSNPLELPTILQQSLLSLLIEHIGWSSKCKIPIRNESLMHRHLHTFINMLMYSRVKDIKDQAYILAQEAMLSTGAFDKNPREIGAWLLFLPGYSRDNFIVKDEEVKIFQNLSSAVVSFLCDAVSTVGKNLFRYWDLLRCHFYNFKGAKDVTPDFSLLVICALEKCLRLLSSESGTFSLPEKSMVSLYVCNTLKYLLQTQVEAGLLSSLITRLLSERLEDHSSEIGISGNFCEWRPLKNLLLFAERIANHEILNILSISRKVVHAGSSNTLGEVNRVVGNGQTDALAGITVAFVFSMLCTAPSEIVQNFPSVISISQNLLGVPFSLLFSVFFLEQGLLTDVCKLWPEIFFTGLEGAVTTSQGKEVKEEIIADIDIKSIGSAPVAFSFFLKRAPFYVLFPAIVSSDCWYPFEDSKLQDFLLAKVSEMSTDQLVYSFRLVLFWIHQIQSFYRIKPLHKLEQLSEMCFCLIECMLAQLFDGKTNYGCSKGILTPLSTQCVQEVAEIIFCHPAVTASMECPLRSNEQFAGETFGESLEHFLGLASQGVHKMDHLVVNMLAVTCGHLFGCCNGQKSICEVDCVNKQIVTAFKVMLQKLFRIFRDSFDWCTKTKDLRPLIPTLFSVHTLIHFMSPFELLELVHWMFSRLDVNESTVLESSKQSAFSVGLCIAGRAFDLVLAYAQQPHTRQIRFDFFWGIREESFDVTLLEKIYFQVFEIATRYELDAAYLCLLKAVNVACIHKVMKNQCLTLCMAMSRVITSTPMKLLSHCIHKTSMTKGKLLFRLTEVSPLHMSIFGHLLSDIMNKSLVPKSNLMQATWNYTLSDEDFVMLLPAALSYLNSTLKKFRKGFYKSFRDVVSFYWRILSCGFSQWKSYVSGDIFQVENGEVLPSSVEELLNIFYGSLLGKAILMLRHYFVLSGDSVKLKKRLRLFDSVCPCSGARDNLLDCDLSEIDAYSFDQSLDLITKSVTKIQFCRMLLFPEDSQFEYLQKEGDVCVIEIPSEVESNKEYLLRIRFINILLSTWKLIVKKFPLNFEDSREVVGTNSSLFRHLEVFILRNILELIAKMRNCLNKSHSLPLIEQLARWSLIHRFEDPATLKMLRSVLTSLSGEKLSHILVLQLLLGHSQFASTIRSASKSSGCSEFGMIFRPMSSILRSLVLPCADQIILHKQKNLQTSELCMRQLEVVKLLRILFHFQAQQSGFDSEKEMSINSRELLFLLLSSYGATLSEIDVEIYNLMHEIESADESNSVSIAEMDFLWGSAAVNIRKEQEREQVLASDDMNDIEAVKENRRSQFRENLPIDPKFCANTVLYFPFDGTTGEKTLSLHKLQQDNSEHIAEVNSANIEKTQIYDPIFILRFSIHSLLMGYIEPLEFASLGLLAVAYVSTSSPEDEVRKLGYEALGRFKTALEKCEKRKDVMRLRLLLTYLQNGIEQSWQRIPSITAVFIAEASVILSDPSHDHYSTISKLLMRSPRVNMKCIPLFDDVFWGSSVNFKMDRLWILRLLYAGQNLDDDAQIYIRNSILEILLSFFASPLSDNESKQLILQVVKKSVKLYKMTRYLVEHCGLLSWLSSVVSFMCGRQYKDHKSCLFTQLTVVLEVINDVVSSRNTVEWLQKYGLEQLTELSSHLYVLLVDGIKLIEDELPLVNLIIQILTSALKISQKRKVYQPHFTLSVEGLFQIYEAIDACSNGRYSPNAELGLKAVLMSAPPATIFLMDQEKLRKFVLWAVSTALQSCSTKLLQPKESYPHFKIFSEEEQSENSLIPKLLRWLTASVIRGRLAWKFSDYNSRSFATSNLETLQSSLKHDERGCGKFGSEDVLAATIFYLQQLIGMNCGVLPSVVSALCLLLFSDTSLEEADFQLGHGSSLASLRLRIRCPTEANPAWRWSFYQPWKDLSYEPTDAEMMDEIHACQTLLAAISTVLGKKSLHSQFLSYGDVEKSGVFEWERSIIETK